MAKLLHAWRNIIQLVVASKRLRKSDRELEQNVKREILLEIDEEQQQKNPRNVASLAREFAGIHGPKFRAQGMEQWCEGLDRPGKRRCDSRANQLGEMG